MRSEQTVHDCRVPDLSTWIHPQSPVDAYTVSVDNVTSSRLLDGRPSET